MSAAIREQTGTMTGAVGLIAEPVQANEIIALGETELVLLGREKRRDPYWALKA